MILLATCQPGLEAVVRGELEGVGFGPMAQVRPGLLRAGRVGADEVAAACRARTVDDLYLEVWAGAPDAFRRLLAAPTLAIPGEVLAAHRAVLAAGGRRPKGRIKATCLLQGRTDLRRQDVEARLGRQVLAAQPSWRLETERPDAEVVAFLSPQSAIVALRVTEPAFRHRHYQRAPAALSPTVAAALARLAVPTPEDRWLDPCCGGGTLLLERAQMGPYRELLGGDVSAAALEVARANFGDRHKPWSLRVWDARALPLPDASVNRVVSNLPFGVQLPAAGGVGPFVQACLREVARVLEPGGRAVLLWPQSQAVIPPPTLRQEREVAFDLVGQAVAARVLVRGA